MMKISDKIKQRIVDSKGRFWACDNIADYITDDERNQLIDEITESFESVIDSLIIDRETDPNSNETPRRLAKMYVNEIMSGRYYKKPDITAFPNEGASSYKGMIVIRSEIKSVCSHHHQPVTGVAYIGIIPNDTVIGLSKYTRLAQWCARRGTLQEELATHIANEIMSATNSEHIAVHIGAEHGCCTNRGILATSSLTQTTVLNGFFNTDPDVKKEFFDNIKLQQSSGGKGIY